MRSFANGCVWSKNVVRVVKRVRIKVRKEAVL
jgi:hypothetical protein